jgi:hypothetical protein
MLGTARTDLVRAIRRLDPASRRVLALSFRDELPDGEIARRLDTSPSQVRLRRVDAVVALVRAMRLRRLRDVEAMLDAASELPREAWSTAGDAGAPEALTARRQPAVRPLALAGAVAAALAVTLATVTGFHDQPEPRRPGETTEPPAPRAERTPRLGAPLGRLGAGGPVALAAMGSVRSPPVTAGVRAGASGGRRTHPAPESVGETPTAVALVPGSAGPSTAGGTRPTRGSGRRSSRPPKRSGAAGLGQAPKAAKPVRAAHQAPRPQRSPKPKRRPARAQPPARSRPDGARPTPPPSHHQEGAGPPLEPPGQARR